MSESAAEQTDALVADFATDLRTTAEMFMTRRGSRTLDATDVADAHGWLTRPPRKAIARDLVASAVVLLSAVVVAYGVNGLFATPATKGAWFIVVVGFLFGTFAEVFRRWEYN